MTTEDKTWYYTNEKGNRSREKVIEESHVARIAAATGWWAVMERGLASLVDPYRGHQQSQAQEEVQYNKHKEGDITST